MKNIDFWFYKVFVTLHSYNTQVVYTCKKEETTEAIKQIVKAICEAVGIELYSINVIKEPIFFMEDENNA